MKARRRFAWTELCLGREEDSPLQVPVFVVLLQNPPLQHIYITMETLARRLIISHLNANKLTQPQRQRPRNIRGSRLILLQPVCKLKDVEVYLLSLSYVMNSESTEFNNINQFILTSAPTCSSQTATAHAPVTDVEQAHTSPN